MLFRHFLENADLFERLAGLLHELLETIIDTAGDLDHPSLARLGQEFMTDELNYLGEFISTDALPSYTKEIDKLEQSSHDASSASLIDIQETLKELKDVFGSEFYQKLHELLERTEVIVSIYEAITAVSGNLQELKQKLQQFYTNNQSFNYLMTFLNEATILWQQRVVMGYSEAMSPRLKGTIRYSRRLETSLQINNLKSAFFEVIGLLKPIGDTFPDLFAAKNQIERHLSILGIT